MKSSITKPNHTPAQRRRMFLLAALLDKLPPERLRMSWWQTDRDGYETDELTPTELKHDCKTAACGCGWAVTIPSIRRVTTEPRLVARRALGFPCRDAEDQFGAASFALFNGQRKCTPKELAADIRRYLKDGVLPSV